MIFEPETPDGQS